MLVKNTPHKVDGKNIAGDTVLVIVPWETTLKKDALSHPLLSEISVILNVTYPLELSG